MARVIRIDTWEWIGYFVDLTGPLRGGRECCMFTAWRHPDGRLRHEPPPRADPRRPDRAPTPVKLAIAVDDPKKIDLALMVPPGYLDFIEHHPAFRRLPPQRVPR